jgi:nuclear-control-of-ATPase protein 2
VRDFSRKVLGCTDVMGGSVAAGRRHPGSDHLGAQTIAALFTPAPTRRYHVFRGRVSFSASGARSASGKLIIDSQIRRIDSQLDRLQLSTASTGGSFSTLTAAEAHDPAKTARIAHLQTLIKSLSTTTSSKSSLVPAYRILETLQRADLSSSCATCSQWFAQGIGGNRQEDGARDDASYEHELEWLLLSKATTQAYGQVLSTILEQTIPLEDDIWYWDDILSTYRFAGLYSVQTSPLRMWKWSQEIYHDVRSRGGQLADGWSQFYGLVKDSVRERSIANIQRRVVSPLAMVRNEGRRKRAALKKIRLINANALGVLLGEGLSNDRHVAVLDH